MVDKICFHFVNPIEMSLVLVLSQIMSQNDIPSVETNEQSKIPGFEGFLLISFSGTRNTFPENPGLPCLKRWTRLNFLVLHFLMLEFTVYLPNITNFNTNLILILSENIIN